MQIIIGLKRLDVAKQRLAAHLTPDQRRQLMLAMLRAVVSSAHQADLGPIALATSEPTGAALADELQLAVLSDGDLPWNHGLVHALGQVVPQPRTVMYLAGDLPLLTAAELAEFAAAAPPAGVCIARARDAGTNALVVTPSDAFHPLFGHPRSSEVHRDSARQLGLPCRVIDLRGLALDVDTIEDARDAEVIPAQLIGRGPAPARG